MRKVIAAALLCSAFSTVHAFELKASDIEALNKIAQQSPCSKYVWKDRGRAPIGYTKGFAQTYAVAYCGLKSKTPTLAIGVAAQPLGPESTDVLTHYEVKATTAVERMRATYTILLGLGMRESSGNTTEGRDWSPGNPSDGNPTADNTEAGLYQVSYDSFNKSPALAAVFNEYHQPGAQCLLDAYMEKVTNKNTPIIGVGAGADFQAFIKSCPAASTQYSAVMIRVVRNHFSPIKKQRKKAEMIESCQSMLKQVEDSMLARCP